MLQRETMPSASSTAVGLGENWRNALKEQWGEQLQDILQLPTTLRGLVIYTLTLALIGGALAVHVMLSVQIMAAQVQVADMERQLAWIEQTNSEITYQIARNASMAKMNRRALDQGYGYRVKRLYVYASATPVRSTAEPMTNKVAPAQAPASSSAPEAQGVLDDNGGIAARIGELSGAALQNAWDASRNGVDAASELVVDQGRRTMEFTGEQVERVRSWLLGVQMSGD